MLVPMFIDTAGIVAVGGSAARAQVVTLASTAALKSARLTVAF
jgi:hypothetical protein